MVDEDVLLPSREAACLYIERYSKDSGIPHGLFQPPVTEERERISPLTMLSLWSILSHKDFRIASLAAAALHSNPLYTRWSPSYSDYVSLIKIMSSSRDDDILTACCGIFHRVLTQTGQERLPSWISSPLVSFILPLLGGTSRGRVAWLAMSSLLAHTRENEVLLCFNAVCEAIRTRMLVHTDEKPFAVRALVSATLSRPASDVLLMTQHGLVGAVLVILAREVLDISETTDAAQALVVFCTHAPNLVCDLGGVEIALHLVESGLDGLPGLGVACLLRLIGAAPSVVKGILLPSGLERLIRVCSDASIELCTTILTLFIQITRSNGNVLLDGQTFGRVVTTAMRLLRHPSSEVCGMHVLRLLSSIPEAALVLVEGYGFVEEMLSFRPVHTKSESYVHDALAIMCSLKLLSNKECATRIISMILPRLGGKTASSAFRVLMCGAAHNEWLDVMTEGHVGPMVVRLVDEARRNRQFKVINMGNLMLQRLCRARPRAAAEVVRVGGIHVFVKCMNTPEDFEASTSSLYALLSLSSLAQVMVMSGMHYSRSVASKLCSTVPLLIRLSKGDRTDDRVHTTSIAEAVARMCVLSEARRQAAKCGAVTLLLDALEAPAGSTMPELIRGLDLLAGTSGAVDEWERARGAWRLLEALSSAHTVFRPRVSACLLRLVRVAPPLRHVLRVSPCCIAALTQEMNRKNQKPSHYAHLMAIFYLLDPPDVMLPEEGVLADELIKAIRSKSSSRKWGVLLLARMMQRCQWSIRVALECIDAIVDASGKYHARISDAAQFILYRVNVSDDSVAKILSVTNGLTEMLQYSRSLSPPMVNSRKRLRES